MGRPRKVMPERVAKVTIIAAFPAVSVDDLTEIVNVVNEALQQFRGIGSATAEIDLPQTRLKL